MKRFWSIDHKTVGMQYFAAGIFCLFFGGLLAMLMRWQLGFPDRPLGAWRMLPDTYHMLFTMHATIMIFFAIVPILVGGIGNYLVPTLIGAPEMAFPKFTRLSFHLYIVAAVIMFWSFFLRTGAAKSGWFAYPPLSALESVGQSYWIVSLSILGISSLLGALNMATTILGSRTRGMTLMRMPLTVWAQFVTSVLLLLSLPTLLVALTFLFSDRVAGTSFFLPEGLQWSGRTLSRSGGQPLLWQHLFWFFGHPEVYIVIMPAMGIVSDVLAVFARKPVFGYRAMVASLAAIGGLGFLVWGHHMFVSGMNPYLGSAFMLSTVVIAAPSGIKTFNWLATLWRGSIQLATPMLCALAFVSVFVLGGLAGIFVAMTPVDVYLHNTAFVTAHFHFMMAGGALFGILAATYYWFPNVTGRLMNETLGRWHIVITFALFNGVFYPMFILGAAGEPRRMFEFSVYQQLAAYQPMRVFITVCAFLMFTVQGLFLFNLVRSLFKGKRADANPWKANTLEWQVLSDPPQVYRGPYEYSNPNRSEDFHSQTEPT